MKDVAFIDEDNCRNSLREQSRSPELIKSSSWQKQVVWIWFARNFAVELLFVMLMLTQVVRLWKPLSCQNWKNHTISQRSKAGATSFGWLLNYIFYLKLEKMHLLVNLSLFWFLLILKFQGAWNMILLILELIAVVELLFLWRAMKFIKRNVQCFVFFEKNSWCLLVLQKLSLDHFPNSLEFSRRFRF